MFVLMSNGWDSPLDPLTKPQFLVALHVLSGGTTTVAAHEQAIGTHPGSTRPAHERLG